MINVVTWNVLHRVHAANWDDGTVVRWPDERLRIAAIAEVVAARGADVVALQEVSGDLLVALRAAVRDREVHAFRYPRVPNVRKGVQQLRDPGEFLVLIGDGEVVAGEAFAGDPGKGLLAVRTSDMLAVCTHVGFGDARNAELARLADVARTGTAVLLGDFNADPATVAGGLGDGFSVAGLPAGAAVTRPGAGAQIIDHVVVRGATVEHAQVVDGGGLSDHNLVVAGVRR
ncbi:endonuclease/exonuclease/phosphatase family protein [Dactylosporangium sp. CS-033363]|uniref:endonuclease/exonuclease/phosphatase family protein n=1 Tax=Dactylosporangium sp. CS-033363 TaxID=3239935 RepID=UPI003D8ADFEF